VRRQPVDFGLRKARLLHLRADFRFGLAAHQRFGLGEEIRQQFHMMIAGFMLADRRGDEVGRNEIGPLMQQLIKRMLAVGPWLAENHRPGGAGNCSAVKVHAFAVRFHIRLLQIGRQAMQMLVIGQDRMRRRAHEIAVPDSDQRQHDGHVLAQRSAAEMFVHSVGAAQQLFKILKPDLQRNGKADRRPQRVTPADPVPEFEHVFRRDAEGLHRRFIGGERDEVLRDPSLAAAIAQKPAPRRFGIGHGFLGGEGFRGDNEQRRFRIARAENIADMLAVDIRNEMRPPPRDPVGPQCCRNHHRPEIRTANADVDNRGEGFARMALARAGMNLAAKGFHLREFSAHQLRNIFSADEIIALGKISQRRMQDRAAFSDVDFLARQHGVAGGLKPGCLRQRLQVIDNRVIHPRFRIVEKQPRRFDGIAGEPARIAIEQRAHGNSGKACRVFLECAPLRCRGNVGHVPGSCQACRQARHPVPKLIRILSVFLNAF